MTDFVIDLIALVLAVTIPAGVILWLVMDNSAWLIPSAIALAVIMAG